MTDGLRALRGGRALVDLSSWGSVLVRGADAAVWLNDLLTAELEGISPNEGRRSLLLSPTGRIRADVTVTPFDDGYLLLQDPIQPSRIDALLAPYVLSSDVHLEDRSQALGLFAVSEAMAVPEGVRSFRPGPVGTAAAFVVPAEAPRPDPGALGLVPATEEDLDAYRIERGIPRVGVDLGEDSLPHEAHLDEAIAYGKGCFLGQEAVAKVRNLGHPPFVVLAVTSSGPVAAGDPVLADGHEVGRVTSAARTRDGSAALVRVRWSARESPISAEDGSSLGRRETRVSAGG
jgi:tRNA-modifying protein YgfZ